MGRALKLFSKFNGVPLIYMPSSQRIEVDFIKLHFLPKIIRLYITDNAYESTVVLCDAVIYGSGKGIVDDVLVVLVGDKV